MTSASGLSALAQADGEGGYALSLGVEGIHCASCVRLIENALVGKPGVAGARVNLTTERLSVSWQGDRAYGDDLCAAVTGLGYKLHPLEGGEEEDRAAAEQKSLLWAIAVSGFASANMMLLSIGLWSSTTETMGMATRDLFHWISALIALPTVLYAGQPFFRSALAVLKERHTNMDVPISLAVILASGMSLFETYQHGEYVYFDSAVMLLFFLLIGRYLDARAKGKARESAANLLSRLAGIAVVLEHGKTTQVPIRELKEGQTVLVATGQQVPADGEVTRGISSVDMSLISGETMPEAIEVGSSVFAGTVNISAPIQVRVGKASDKSLLSEIVRLLETAEQGNATYVRLADRAAQLYTPVVHSVAAITFIAWWLVFGMPWQISLMTAVTVLIITCPCALGLAVPVVQVLASGKLMRAGVLLKSGDALEKLAKIDTVVFDKTGTLTLGHPELVSGGYDDAALGLAASLAAHSRHPLSKALVRAYDGDLIEMDVKEFPGKGLSAAVDGKEARVGSRAWCGEAGEQSEDSALEMWLSVDGVPTARFAFTDQLRYDATDVIARLARAGIAAHLLSGDREEVAQDVGASAGIHTVKAGVTPVEKCDYIAALKAEGRSTLMVGDGLNDAPALATADVSMSPSSAMDITQNTADIVFQGDQLAPVATAYQTACLSSKLVKQNFILAGVYNVVAVPLAMAGMVTPMVAAIAMSGSSLVVILNAFRLNLKRGG